MRKINKFNLLVGKTLHFCQLIEHDVKIMYACMLEGDPHENFEAVKEKTLGDALKSLEEIDKKDGNLYLSLQEYKQLNQIRNIRNNLAHNIYEEFVYLKGKEYKKALKEKIEYLQTNLKSLKILSKKIEKSRIKLAKKCKYDKRRSKKLPN